jgi:hypothetical protein
MQTQMNYAPEGHNGSTSGQANEMERDYQAEEHDYDDGLVHGHSWAVSSED